MTSVVLNQMNYENTSVLGVSRENAQKITKDNGLKEVIVNVGDKDVIAYGREMSLKGIVPGAAIQIGNQQGTVVHVDDEPTTYMEGALKGALSGWGIAIGAGGLVGGAAVGYGLEFIKVLGGAQNISVGAIGFAAVSVAAIGIASYAAYKGSQAEATQANYGSINNIVVPNK